MPVAMAERKLTRASQLLVEWRTKRGLQQNMAAQFIGVAPVTLCGYEHGVNVPRVRLALMIARVTGGAVPVESWGQEAV